MPNIVWIEYSFQITGTCYAREVESDLAQLFTQGF
jgi:hypothetical protein